MFAIIILLLLNSFDHILLIFVDNTCFFQYDRGESYNGTVNTTVNGDACMNWLALHSMYTPYYQDHNYCRNPRLDTVKQYHFDQLWCYINDKYISGLCNITSCGKYNIRHTTPT